jgi:hypothetical protein
MQYRCDARCCPQIFSVCTKFHECFRNCLEEQAVCNFLILIENRVKFFRHSKHHMKVANIQQILILLFNPLFFGEGLAFGTMAVTARVVRYFFKSTLVTNIHVCA